MHTECRIKNHYITMSFKFEKRIIWQDSMTFGERIDESSLPYPKDELLILFHRSGEQLIRLR